MALSWFAVQAGLLALAALAAGAAVARRVAAALLVLAAAILPWFAPAAPVPRAVLGAMSVLAFMKTIQIAGTNGPWPAWRRVWHGLTPFDVRRATSVAPALDWQLLARVASYTAAAVAAFLVGVWGLDALTAPARYVAGMLCAAVTVYAGFEALAGAIRLVHLVVGIDAPPIQRAPILSRSVGEFWGERWNRTVGEWLHRFAFLPLARRRHPLLGLLAAFAMSAVLHAWMFAVALDVRAALMAGAFFLVQGVAVLAETRMGARAWPSPLARGWTVFVLLAPSPLILGPVLRLVGE